MKQLFSPRLTALTLALILVLLLPGCNNPVPIQTEKVSVDNPPIAEQPKTDEILTPTPKEEVKEQNPVESKTAANNEGAIQSKTYEDPETGWMVYESLEEGLKFKFEYPKSFNLIQERKDFDYLDFKKIDSWITDENYWASSSPDGTIYFNFLGLYNKNYDIKRSPIDKDYDFEITSNPKDSPSKISLGFYLKRDSSLNFSQWIKPILEKSKQCENQDLLIKEVKINSYDAFEQIIKCPDPYMGPAVLFKDFFIDNDNIIWSLGGTYYMKNISESPSFEDEKVLKQIVDSFTLL